MQIVMPQRNTEPFPCRRGSEIAADRYEAPKFLDVNPSLLQRDNLQWRLRELLQAKDNLQMRLEKNQQDLLRQDEMYDALLREENLLFQRRLDPYFFTSAQRRIREDLQDVQWKKRLLFRDHDILRQDEEWIKHEIWKLEWERHHESLRRPLSSSRTRPESAPRSADFGHSVSTRARAHERSHTPVPALKPIRQQSAPFQSPKAVKPDTFDTRISFPSSLSSSLPTPGGLPLLPQSGHLATHTLASSQIRTSPASSPSHSLAPVTNMASATASTEATLQDMQDTVLPDLTDPLKERLEEHELQELHVLGDGNCQFRALADQLAPYYSQECHENVRAAVVQQLRCVPDRYRPFVTEDYDEWVDRMAADKEWGNEITLRAAADAFGVEIHVFADNLGEGQLYSSYEPMKKKMDKLIRLVFRSVRGDSGHYNSVESYKKGFPLK